MSVYTTTIWEVFKNRNDYIPEPIPDMIEKYRKIIFDFDYPTTKIIDKNEFKKWFETAFLVRFLTWEIGFTTLEEFKLQLWHYCNVYLPFYTNMIDKYTSMTDKELLNQWSSTTVTDGEDTRVTNRDTNDLTVHSTLPSNMIDAGSIKDTRYADDATRYEGSRNDNSKGTEDRTVTENRTNGSIIEQLVIYYDLFENLYTGLFDKFNKLFFGILL